MAESDMSSDQTEKLQQFQDLTGLDDTDKCKELLERHNWDMEVAVQDHLNAEEGSPSVYEEPAGPIEVEPRAPTVDNNPVDQRVVTIQRSAPHGLVQWGYFAMLFPFQFIYSTIRNLLTFIFSLFRPDPRRNVTDPLGDVINFIRMYEDRYGDLHPTFYQGTYSQVLNDAKSELRFLLVYLHGDDHQDTEVFCRVTLSNEALVEFINTRCLFWACNTNSPEGYRVSQALRESTYPFLALIVLRQNKMTVIAKIEGRIEPGNLQERLTLMMEENEGSIVAARAERDELSFNQTLRAEQDEAYLESLRADQEKEKRKRIEEEDKRLKESEEKIRVEEEARKIEEIAEKKERLKQSLPNEPLAGDDNVIRVLLKLPSGSRLERRFYRDQSIQYLFNYVFCHEEAPDDFQIVTNFPRKTLPCAPTDGNAEPPTFTQMGLGKSEMLFVHDNEA